MPATGRFAWGEAKFAKLKDAIETGRAHAAREARGLPQFWGCSVQCHPDAAVKSPALVAIL